MKCCLFQNGESEGANPLNDMQRSFPSNRKKQDPKQSKMSTPLRADTGVCAAKDSKVADHGGPPTCLGGLDITVVRQGRREGRREAFGCRKRFLEETGQPGFKKKKKKKRASSAP